MARQKAEELEDFSTTETAEQPKPTPSSDQYSQDEVEEGSALLKEMLLKWKAEIEGKDLSSEQKRQIMRDLVKGDQRLQANKVFQGIKAL
jgi:DNA mismatch repair protein MSH2